MSQNMLNIETDRIWRAPKRHNPTPRAPTPTPPPLKTKKDVPEVPKAQDPKELKEAEVEGATSTAEADPATLTLEASAMEQKGCRTCLKRENSPIPKKENVDTSHLHCCDDLLAEAFENDEYINDFKLLTTEEAAVQTDNQDNLNTVVVERGMLETLCDICFLSDRRRKKNMTCPRFMKRKSKEPEVVSVAPRPALIPRGPISFF